MLRFFDITVSGIGLIFGFPILCLLVILSSINTGSPFFLQKRLGREKKVFTLFKFRTMKTNTPSVATHLVDSNFVTPIGRMMRKAKLDELPQLLNVLMGDMSLVGPRPCLPSQYQLIHERTKRGVFGVCPGITGLAQINSVDMSEPKMLAEIDAQMIESLSLVNYWKYIIATILGGGLGDPLKNKND